MSELARLYICERGWRRDAWWRTRSFYDRLIGGARWLAGMVYYI